MNRREFLRSATLGSAALAWSGAPRPGAPALSPGSEGWRTSEVTTRIEVLRPDGIVRVWVPVPLTIATPYQQPLGTVFEAPNGRARLLDDRARGFGMVAAEWPPGATPALTAVSRVKTRDVSVNLTAPSHAGEPDRATLARFREPSALIPSDELDCVQLRTRRGATGRDGSEASVFHVSAGRDRRRPA